MPLLFLGMFSAPNSLPAATSLPATTKWTTTWPSFSIWPYALEAMGFISIMSTLPLKLYQFSEDSYWCSLDYEIYCHIFEAHAPLPCSLCVAASYPACLCSIPAHTKPWPSSERSSAFSCLSAVDLSAPLPPRPMLSASSIIFSVTRSIDKKECLSCTGEVVLFATISVRLVATYPSAIS